MFKINITYQENIILAKMNIVAWASMQMCMLQVLSQQGQSGFPADTW